MNIRKLMIVAALLIFGTTIAPAPQALGNRPMNETPANQSVFLREYLVQLGKDYDRFFTLEEAWKDGESMNMLEFEWVQGFSEMKGLQQDLERLRQTVPNFTFETNKQNPRIIHIIDARLKRLKGYGLESTIQSIDFTGTVDELVTAIGEHGMPVSPRGVSDISEGLSQDYRTEVHVKGKGLKVRDALSNFISLDGRGRVIWIARTKIGQREMSYVHFHGAPKLLKQ